MTNGKLNANYWKNNSGRSCKVTLIPHAGKTLFGMGKTWWQGVDLCEKSGSPAMYVHKNNCRGLTRQSFNFEAPYEKINSPDFGFSNSGYCAFRW